MTICEALEVLFESSVILEGSKTLLGRSLILMRLRVVLF